MSQFDFFLLLFIGFTFFLFLVGLFFTLIRGRRALFRWAEWNFLKVFVLSAFFFVSAFASIHLHQNLYHFPRLKNFLELAAFLSLFTLALIIYFFVQLKVLRKSLSGDPFFEQETTGKTSKTKHKNVISCSRHGTYPKTEKNRFCPICVMEAKEEYKVKGVNEMEIKECPEHGIFFANESRPSCPKCVYTIDLDENFRGHLDD